MFPSLLFFLCIAVGSSSADVPLFLRGFNVSSMTLSGNATISPSGLLQLTDNGKQEQGQAFFSSPFQFKQPNSSSSSSVSFSSRFVIETVPKYEDTGGHGLTFAFVPTTHLTGSLSSQSLGLFDKSNMGNTSYRIFAVEFDTVLNSEYKDIDGNHVGIDINSLVSNTSSPAAYLDGNSQRQPIKLTGAQPIQVLIGYDGKKKHIKVTIWPADKSQPQVPLLDASVDLAAVLANETYLGFTASNGDSTGSHYILGWSFSFDGEAPELDLRKLPRPPLPRKKISRLLVTVLALCAAIVAILLPIGLVLLWRWRKKYAEVMEEWEREYGPHRFSFRELYRATGGFKEEHVIGFGGFGKVYRGVIQTSQAEVAVKRVSHDSQQGMREFVAEIASMGRLRHRNLVPLLGYCRRKGELLLVYEYMPNGSLDNHLHKAGRYPPLRWNQRLKIVKGVAQGLFYLHHGCEQVVVHRDVKAANVLLDGEMDGRLSDFGLAKLHDHGVNPQTTRVVGTLGYLAPEITKTGKPTTSSDVYAFGAFLLEVACGRRPIETGHDEERHILLDWVLRCWRRGAILKASDPRLAGDFPVEEVEMIMQLGLLCSHPVAAARPSMRQVVAYLDGDAQLPAVHSPNSLHESSVAIGRNDGFDDYANSYPITGVSVAESSSSRRKDWNTSPMSPMGNDDELLLRRIAR